MTQPFFTVILCEDVIYMSLKVRDTSIPRCLWFTFIINVAFVVWIKWHPVPPAVFKGITDLFDVLIALMGAWWGLQRVRGKNGAILPGRQKWAADLVGLGVLAYALGMVVWFYYEVLKHQDTPFPSWADAYYLASYPLLMIGVLLMPTRSIPSALRGRVLLDSLMIMTGLVTFSWYFLLGPTVIQGSETLLGRVLGVGYPIGDLAVLFCLLVISAHPAEAAMRASRRMLSWGLIAYVVADVGYGYMTLKGNYVTGQLIDAGWTVGNLLIGLGVASYRRAASAVSPQAGGFTAAQDSPVLWRALLPYAFVPAVGMLLCYVLRHTGDEKLHMGVYIGSAALIVLVGLRQVFALLENNRIFRHLQEAYGKQEADSRSLSESNAHLQTLATTDGMTGLPNHRAFQERLRQEVSQAKRTGRTVTFLLLDVDRFKLYNDSFGHPAGDDALRIVARLIRENLRESDFAARYGGEEFAVILPETDATSAVPIAERMRATVESHAFCHGPITLSIGLAVLASGEEVEALINHADAALYTAKHEGRNCLRLSDYGPSSAAPALGKVDAALPEQEALAASGLLAVLSLRNGETEEHSEKVARYAVRLADEAVRMGLITLSAEAKQTLLLGALLHDIGKIGTPDLILNNPESLDATDWSRMCEHPAQGVRLLHGFPSLSGAIPVVLHHHERWDGSGYPSGLARERIPLAARLVAIVDALDAMISDRPYRKALSLAAAREEIARAAGTQFDPALAEAFLAIPSEEWRRLRKVPARPRAERSSRYLKAA